MPILFIAGVFISLYAVALVILYIYVTVTELREKARARRQARSHVRIEQQTMATVRQIDQLTEQAVAQILAEAARQRWLREGGNR